MSSRKKSQENSDSCRNLDGRRMRTVKEAKALAAWLEVKPEMDRKEREVRMQRWRDIIDAAERKEEGKGERFQDTEWLEGLEEGKERTREAVLRSLKEIGLVEEEESSGESSDSGDAEAEGSGAAAKRAVAEMSAKEQKPVQERKFAGWDDEDDEFMSDSDDDMAPIKEENEDENEDEEMFQVKGKGKAVAAMA